MTAGAPARRETRQSVARPSRKPLATHRQRDADESTAYAAKRRRLGNTNVLMSGYQPKARLENVKSTTARTPQARAPARRAAWRYPLIKTFVFPSLLLFAAY